MSGRVRNRPAFFAKNSMGRLGELGLRPQSLLHGFLVKLFQSFLGVPAQLELHQVNRLSPPECKVASAG